MLRRVAPTPSVLRRQLATSAAGPSNTLLGAWRFCVNPIMMPALSPTSDKGSIAEWRLTPGDAITDGTPLCMVETDKATVAFNHVGDDGFLARIVLENGTKDIPIGRTIALMVDSKDEVGSDAVKNWKPEAGEGGAAAPAAPAAKEKKDDAPQQKEASSPAPASSRGGGADGGRVFASPLARKTAAEEGVDLATVQGSGGSVGRVTKDDVLKAKRDGPTKPAASEKGDAAASSSASASKSSAPKKPAAPAAATAASLYEDIPVSNMRSVIAQRLTQSKNVDVPHYYVSKDCKADNMAQLLKHLNAKGDGKFKISVNDFIIKCIARANLLVPQCNTHWHGDFMRHHKTVDVSVAVATDNGLITPIIKNAHIKGLAEISIEMKELAKKAREGTLQPAEYQGGTVTVSNMGGLGVDNFTAIINPPHSMILACGGVRPQPVMEKNADGEYEMTGKVETVVNFTASFDHRVVDGAVGAEWFKHYKETFENPLALLL